MNTKNIVKGKYFINPKHNRYLMVNVDKVDRDGRFTALQWEIKKGISYYKGIVSMQYDMFINHYKPMTKLSHLFMKSMTKLGNNT